MSVLGESNVNYGGHIGRLYGNQKICPIICHFVVKLHMPLLRPKPRLQEKELGMVLPNHGADSGAGKMSATHGARHVGFTKTTDACPDNTSVP